ncbi:MAG: GDSL-type esterase/lipase family protein [Campylobacter sp.]|uniref:GDSL-type esterase/lipase family protein n=1 Tax=Campylobacter sp. TaxID=205 RepID=UPI002A809BAB|nr:GDSL-type esterase/lipase family protein [Campylobacter sp.]MDY5115335.1 GDSL-type esterase/lipase family protein [Campylobacter sp.]
MNKILASFYAFLGLFVPLLLAACAQKIITGSSDEMLTKKELKRLNISQNGRGVKFFGDSHVASGAMVSAFRDEYFGASVGSVGFVPAAMSKYHAHSELSFESNGFEVLSSRRDKYDDYALCGVVAKADENATMSLKLKKLKGLFGVEILHKFSQSGEIFTLKDANAKEYKITQKSPDIWEYSTFELSFPLEIKALKNGVELGGYKIYQKGDFVDFCAANGAYSSISAKWSAEAWSRDFAGFDYELFILGYGTNDALDKNFSESGFYNSMKSLIAKLKSTSKNAKLVLVAPPPSPKIKKMPLVISALKRLARDENAIFVDTKAFVESSGGWKDWRKNKLVSRDNLHLSHDGYKKIGAFIAKSVKNEMKN